MALSCTTIVCLLLPHLVLASGGVYRQVIVLVSLEDPAVITTLSALQYAADSINEDPTILPTSVIELVPVDSGGCGEGIKNDEYESLVELISGIVASAEVIGVVGPFCAQYPLDIDLVTKTVENFGVFHISGSLLHHVFRTHVPVSLISLASEEFFLSSLSRIMDHFGWHRIGLISSVEQESLERLIEKSIKYPVNIVFKHVISSKYSIASVVQDIQKIDLTVFLLSIPLNRVYQLICYVYKYYNHLMWPRYVWIMFGHWFEDILNEYRATQYPGCTHREVEYAFEGIMLLNLHLEPEDVNHTTVSGKTFKEYITTIPTSTVSEQYRSNLAFDSLWTLALAVNSTEDGQELVRDRGTRLEFNGTLCVKNHTRVDIAQVSNGIYTTVGFYSKEGMNVNNSIFDFIPADSLPRVRVGLPSWMTYVFIVVIVAIELYVAALTFLYFYFRKEPEVKATSPYLNLFGFAGLYLAITAAETMITTLSGREEYVTGPLCIATIWLFNHGDALYIITLLVRLVRIYRVFNYFGKTGRQWSDIVLVAVIIGLVSIVTVNTVFWTVFNAPSVATEEIVKNGTVFVEHYCDIQTSISFYICISYALILRLLLVIFSVKTRNIKREHFKDTKKINLLIYLNIPLGYLFLMSLIIFINTRNAIVGTIETMLLLTLVILYATLLILPKIWAPLLRKVHALTCLKHRKTKHHMHTAAKPNSSMTL